jgi:DNA invertase Pin-like site-specific DNA recombinase
MRVAIYARYSSENQSEKSIDDQVRVCKNYLHDHGLTVEERHIFVDEAISGSIINRPGLQVLENAVERKDVDAVVVDDLSRLSRSNHQMLTMVLKFNYHLVKIISVSEGITTDDENSKLSIHIRGFINELYLDDLKKKTMRGLEGQKIRGFSAGENVYGYFTQPVGEPRFNRKGEPKYAGMAHKIHPEEAEIVRQIYEEFVNGKSLAKIVESLNNENIPAKRGRPGGWNTSSLSRILKNEKYIGDWIWQKYKNARDPVSGKTKKYLAHKRNRWYSFRKTS